MARSTPDSDSGSYVNGVYTSKNGDQSSGLNCPKGVRLYDPNMKPAIFFQPPDTGATEEFVPLTQDAAQDVLPNYAISNYGRILNMHTGKVMKPNYRPNGYEYYCLCAENAKYGQKKYNTHRMVMKTFVPNSDADNLEVNHINSVKSDNYINKTMPDGSIQSNLEWCTHEENTEFRSALHENVVLKLTRSDAATIRQLHDDDGLSYAKIREEYYPSVSEVTIQRVCRNKTFKDSTYTPKDYKENLYKNNTGKNHILTDSEAACIRRLAAMGYNYTEIKEQFFPTFSTTTISDVVRGLSHNRDF